jgi:hypothetical protein
MNSYHCCLEIYNIALFEQSVARDRVFIAHRNKHIVGALSI